MSGTKFHIKGLNELKAIAPLKALDTHIDSYKYYESWFLRKKNRLYKII